MTRLDFPGFDLERARRYGRARRLAALGQMAASAARSAAFVATGHSQRTRDRIGARVASPALADAAHIALLSCESRLLSLPERYLTGQKLERDWGMTKRADRDWLREEVVSLLVECALVAPLGAGALAIVRRQPERWHLIVPAVAIPIQLALVQLAPVLIFPLFNRFEPVDDAELTARIEGLAARAGVELGGVYVADMSRQTEKANAFFAGLGATKRVVLGDTLLRSFDDDEVDGVVAHELGHQVHGDLWRLSAAQTLAGIAAALALKRVMPRVAAGTARWTGTAAFDTSGSLPLWSLAAGTIGAVISPALLAMNRAIERRTDAFAVALTGDGDAFARGLERLLRQNLDDPYPPAWVTVLFRSHPPTGERIEAARAG